MPKNIGLYNDDLSVPRKKDVPTKTSELTNDSGFITIGDVPDAPVTSVNGKTGTVLIGKSDVGLGNVENVKQYSATNPPPYPVTSVNGQTGEVIIDADVPDNIVRYYDVVPIQAVEGLNTDTLEGHRVSYFATASELSATNTQVSTLNSGLSTANDNISALQTVGNPNLLDNWYFVNPVNQRGLKSYANSSGFYGIDRWRIASGLSNSCYVEINDGYVSFVNANTTPGSYIYFGQNFEYDITPTGVPRTVSIMDKDGILRSYTGQNGTSWEYDNGIYVYQASQKSLNFRLDAGKRLDMKAVKLELGSRQTFAHQDASGNWVLNEIPNYEEQLARCQRYAINLSGPTAYGVLGFGIARDANVASIFCPLPVSMCTTPTVSFSGSLCVSSTATVGGSPLVTAVRVDHINSNGITLDVTAPGLTAGAACQLWRVGDSSAYILLSTDL